VRQRVPHLVVAGWVFGYSFSSTLKLAQFFS
jgi:hypothetical protein